MTHINYKNKCACPKGTSTVISGQAQGNTPIQPIGPEVIYSKRNHIYLNTNTWEGLPSWIPEGSRRAIFRSIATATAGLQPFVKWVAPITVATQLKITLTNNSQTTPDADANFNDVILRAIPKFQGINAIDTVKVIVAEGVCLHV